MLGISTSNLRVGGFRKIIDPQASAFYNRVIADGGVVPTGLIGVSATFKAIKAIYGVTDIATAVSVFYDAHYLGYKLGPGTGTTLGQSCTKLYSACGASGDVVQATLTSQPLLLAHNGVDNYWFGSGVSGNFCSIASQTALKFNADFSVVVNIESYQASTSMELAGSSGGWAAFAIILTGILRFDFAGTAYNSTTTLPANTKWIRFSANGTGLLFYTSTDGITWTQLGATVTMGARSTPASIQIYAGNGSANVALPLNGKIKSIKYYSDSNLATLVYSFNANDYNASVSQTQFTALTGEVWTINTGTAATGYKGVLVDRTTVMSDGVDDSLINASFTLQIGANVIYAADTKFNSTKINPIVETSVNTNSNRGLFIWENDGGNLTSIGVNSNVAINVSAFLINNTILKLNTAVFDVSLSAANETNTFLINDSLVSRNSVFANGENTATGMSTGIYLFSRAGLSFFANIKFNTLIISNSVNNSTIRTAMYNFIRGLNNNAF